MLMKCDQCCLSPIDTINRASDGDNEGSPGSKSGSSHVNCVRHPPGVVHAQGSARIPKRNLGRVLSIHLPWQNF
ncbi:unnamed protein product [Prunus brigantina]